jgi:CBS domain-containing protein
VPLRGGCHRTPASDDVMSTDLITIAPDEPVGLALEIFRARAIRRLPVVDRDRMAGCSPSMT